MRLRSRLLKFSLHIQIRYLCPSLAHPTPLSLIKAVAMDS
jgi:hypothetical protein